MTEQQLKAELIRAFLAGYEKGKRDYEFSRMVADAIIEVTHVNGELIVNYKQP